MTTIMDRTQMLCCLRDSGITGPDGRHRAIGYPASTLAAWTGVTAAAAIALLDALEQDDLVLRIIQPDPRPPTYALSPEGLEIVGAGRPAADSEGPDSGQQR